MSPTQQARASTVAPEPLRDDPENGGRVAEDVQNGTVMEEVCKIWRIKNRYMDVENWVDG